MTACAQYKHPLMNLFQNVPENERDKRYFNEYYYESDIDVMVMSKTIYEFLDITKKFHEKIMLCVNLMNLIKLKINRRQFRPKEIFRFL